MKRCFRPSPFVLGPSPAIHSFFGTGGPLKRSKATVPFLSLFSLAEKRLGALKRGEKERERTRRKRGEILANLVHDSGELRTAFFLSLALLSRSLLCTAGWKGGF